jgi:hypothetical protein
MKTILAILFAATLSGCALFQPSTGTSTVFTPENVAKASSDALAISGALFLQNNPSYAGELLAAADAIAALAASNPAVVTGTDIAAALGKTSISEKTQGQISAAVSLALGIFVKDFSTNLPTLKPQYALFVKAAANGLYAAVGHAPIP